MEVLFIDLVRNVGKLNNIVELDFFVVVLSNLEVNAAGFITNSSTVDLVFTFTRDLNFEDLADDNLSLSARLQMSNLGRSWESLESLGINLI